MPCLLLFCYTLLLYNYFQQFFQIETSPQKEGKQKRIEYPVDRGGGLYFP
jgi:hypothetical protein